MATKLIPPRLHVATQATRAVHGAQLTLAAALHELDQGSRLVHLATLHVFLRRQFPQEQQLATLMANGLLDAAAALAGDAPATA